MGSFALHGALALVCALLARRARPATPAALRTTAPVELTFEEVPDLRRPLPVRDTGTSVRDTGGIVRDTGMHSPGQGNAAPGHRNASSGTSPAPPPTPSSPSPLPAPPAPAPTQPVPSPAPPVPAPTQPAPSPTIDALALLRDTRRDTERLVGSGAIALDVGPLARPSRDLVTLPSGTPLERAREASAGYVRERMNEAPARPEAPGVRTYYWHLRRRMVETWRPGLAREPSIGDTLLATLALPAGGLARAAESALGSGARPGRIGSTMDAADSAHPSTNPYDRPTAQPVMGLADLAQLNTRVTRVEVQVDQNEEGRVLDIRIVRSSRSDGYDRAALDAVREALPLETPARLPGGRRSRWSFETVASRVPFVPGVGMMFDESSGWFEVVYPGRLITRSRVWIESVRPLPVAM